MKQRVETHHFYWSNVGSTVYKFLKTIPWLEPSLLARQNRLGKLSWCESRIRRDGGFCTYWLYSNCPLGWPQQMTRSPQETVTQVRSVQLLHKPKIIAFGAVRRHMYLSRRLLPGLARKPRRKTYSDMSLGKRAPFYNNVCPINAKMSLTVNRYWMRKV